jgi:hypothetical protein
VSVDDRRVGAGASNTAPTNANDGISLVGFGVDTLILNVYGDLNENLLAQLDLAKELAQASAGDEYLAPLPSYDGENLMLYASGVKHYDFLARCGDLTVTLRRPSRSPLPGAVVRIASAALWRLGGGGRVACDLALAWIHEVFGDGLLKVQVARADLAADFQGWAPTYADTCGVVRRADSLDLRFSKRGELETVAAGRSTRLRLSLYNKSKEVMKSGKTWFRDLWAAAGANDQRDVWRCEYQYGREFLHQHGIETVDQFWAGLDGLWAYGLAWFRFAVPNEADMSHPHRWPVNAAWEVLRSARPGEATLALVKQVRPRFDRLAAAAFGYVQSLEALGEFETAYDAFDRLLAMTKQRLGTLEMEKRLLRKQVKYAGRTMAA